MKMRHKCGVCKRFLDYSDLGEMKYLFKSERYYDKNGKITRLCAGCGGRIALIIKSMQNKR